MGTNSLIGKSYINNILSKYSTLVYRLALVITKSKGSANEITEKVIINLEWGEIWKEKRNSKL